MSPVRVTLRPRAQADLAQIWRYTAKTWSMQQADAYLRQIETSLDGLAVDDGRDTPTEAGGPGYFKRRVGSHSSTIGEARQAWT